MTNKTIIKIIIGKHVCVLEKLTDVEGRVGSYRKTYICIREINGRRRKKEWFPCISCRTGRKIRKEVIKSPRTRTVM